VLGGDLLSYVRAEPQLTIVAYSPLLNGGYVRQDKSLDAEFDHPGTPARPAGGPARGGQGRRRDGQPGGAGLADRRGGPDGPLVGASSVAQLDESLAAVDLELTADQRARLDAAR
jgi:aryl-alcohol dehydrogenase-like predicted oxidoreductase